MQLDMSAPCITNGQQKENNTAKTWVATLALPVAALLLALCVVEPVQIFFGLLGVACYIFFQRVPAWICATPLRKSEARLGVDKLGYPLCTASNNSGNNARNDIKGTSAERTSMTVRSGRVAALLKAKEQQRKQQLHCVAPAPRASTGRVAQLMARKEKKPSASAAAAPDSEQSTESSDNDNHDGQLLIGLPQCALDEQTLDATSSDATDASQISEGSGDLEQDLPPGLGPFIMQSMTEEPFDTPPGLGLPYSDGDNCSNEETVNASASSSPTSVIDAACDLHMDAPPGLTLPFKPPPGLSLPAEEPQEKMFSHGQTFSF